MGNQSIFDRAMEQSQQAARNGDWPKALMEGVRAMQEFPLNNNARHTVATALFHTNKLSQSLQLFAELHAAEPENIVFIDYLARIYRQDGETDKAIDYLLKLADQYANQQLTPKAVQTFRSILELNPKHEEARIRLAMLLSEAGDKPAALREFLVLAQQYLDAGELEGAGEAVGEALKVDPSSLSAKDLQDRLTAALEAREIANNPQDDGKLRTREDLERAAQQAIQFQTEGRLEEASHVYERLAEAMPDRADIRYSLGLIYEELHRPNEAIRQLELATQNDEYALSAHFALGTVLKDIGKLERAAQEYENAIRYVDLQSIGKDEVDDLISMYESTAEIYQELGDIARVATLYSTLAGFFQGKRWGAEQAAQFQAKAKELTDRSMMSKLRMLGTSFLEPQAPTEPEPEATAETWGRMPSITDFLQPGREGTPTDRAVASLDALLTTSAPPPASATLLTDIDPLDVLAASLPPVGEVHFAPLSSIDVSDRSDRIQRLVEASERYANQNLLYAALDACHEVIRHDQEFYAIHLRMAEVLERMGRADEALFKLNLLISTYKARHEPTKAINVFYKLIDLSGDSAPIRTELAELLRQENRPGDAAEQLALVGNQQFRMGQTMKALETYRRALEWAPENAIIRAQYGQVLLKLERWEAALEEFGRVLQQHPDDLVVLAQTNIALAMQGEYPEAIWDTTVSLMERAKQQPHLMNDVQAEYRSILLLADRPILQFLLGLIQQATGMHSAALLSFEQALDMLNIEDDPLLPRIFVHQAMSDSYLAEEKVQQAIEQLQKIEGILLVGSVPPLSTKHSFVQPYNDGELNRRMAEAYAAGENYEGAIVALQKVKQLLPYDRAAYTKLADIYFRQGRLPEAMAQLEELATYYENQSQLDRALEILSQALKLAPNNITIKSRYAQLQMRRGYLDDGLASLDELSDLQRKQGLLKDAVQSIQQAADVYWTLGQVQKATDLYNKIVQIAPNDTEARQHLVSFSILSGRSKDAIEQLREIARLSVQQRNYEEAIACYHQVIALDQTDSNAYEQLADVLMRVNEYAQAVRVYKQLSKLIPGDERVEALQSAAQRMLDQQNQQMQQMANANPQS